MKCYLVGTQAGTTSVQGKIIYYGSSYMESGELYTGSDIKLKKNITPITQQFINKLFELNNISYEFDWRDSNKHTSGFIAQYLQDIMPECVDYNDKNDEYSVNYNAACAKLIGALFKKVKEQDMLIKSILDKLS